LQAQGSKPKQIHRKLSTEIVCEEDSFSDDQCQEMQQSAKSCDEKGSDEDSKDVQQFGLKG